ncbi:unnamed protein product [Gordionus sp. m RMFG-2023]
MENVESKKLGSNQNASYKYVDSLVNIIDNNDVSLIIENQAVILERFEKSDEMLANLNSLLKSRYDITMLQIRKHANILILIRKDLEYIHKKIKSIKLKLS